MPPPSTIPPMSQTAKKMISGRAEVEEDVEQPQRDHLVAPGHEPRHRRGGVVVERGLDRLGLLHLPEAADRQRRAADLVGRRDRAHRAERAVRVARTRGHGRPPAGSRPTRRPARRPCASARRSARRRAGARRGCRSGASARWRRRRAPHRWPRRAQRAYAAGQPSARCSPGERSGRTPRAWPELRTVTKVLVISPAAADPASLEIAGPALRYRQLSR